MRNITGKYGLPQHTASLTHIQPADSNCQQTACTLPISSMQLGSIK